MILFYAPISKRSNCLHCIFLISQQCSIVPNKDSRFSVYKTGFMYTNRCSIHKYNFIVHVTMAQNICYGLKIRYKDSSSLYTDITTEIISLIFLSPYKYYIVSFGVCKSVQSIILQNLQNRLQILKLLP